MLRREWSRIEHARARSLHRLHWLAAAKARAIHAVPAVLLHRPLAVVAAADAGLTIEQKDLLVTLVRQAAPADDELGHTLADLIDAVRTATT